ncbi:hypothetical protein HOU02_gp185 [Caulobacter phage CcrBL9]|uniref:Uncharacterized protein n=1 Tax=Caulobacter phage CcrBL9 TaxID=2283270 RepID=A0A385ED08_9CAUD|nr:hypothetical protein HOU02_gp185 [Caulobacter phage CcrBL9]AXQ69540.1 hypothetical protein CcrBL9_gp516c [Caulobacter phage CcrBL9]
MGSEGHRIEQSRLEKGYSSSKMGLARLVDRAGLEGSA